MENKITMNGKPARIGSMYFEREGEVEVRKYCTGYCSQCKRKQGLMAYQLKEFSENLPHTETSFFLRLLHLKIILP